MPDDECQPRLVNFTEIFADRIGELVAMRMLPRDHAEAVAGSFNEMDEALVRNDAATVAKIMQCVRDVVDGIVPALFDFVPDSKD